MVFVYLFLGLALAQASVMALRHRGPAARAALALVAVLMLLDFVPVHLSATPAACPPALTGHRQRSRRLRRAGPAARL